MKIIRVNYYPNYMRPHPNRIVFYAIMKLNMKRPTLSQKILLFLEENKDLYTMISRPYLWGKDYPKKNPKQSFYKAVYRLKEEGFLEEIEAKGERRYRATLKGKVKILRFFKKDKKWDSKWRIVVFDIPEKKKKMRNYFREKLYDLGFRKLQESVWISPYNIADKIGYLIEICNARNYVHYLLVEELDNRDALMNLFKLSGLDTTRK